MIDVVEAAYDLPDPQVDDATWAGRVHGALHPLLDRGMGSGVFLSAPERPFAAVGAQGLSPRWPEAMRQLMTSAAAPCLLHPPRPACTASQGVGPEALAENPAIVGPWKELGVADGVGLVADDGTGHIDRRAYPTVPTRTRLEFAKPIPVRPSPGPPSKKKAQSKGPGFLSCRY